MTSSTKPALRERERERERERRERERERERERVTCRDDQSLWP